METLTTAKRYASRYGVKKCITALLCYCTVAERPVHCLENVADIWSRWSHWPDEFQHNNYLIIKPYALVEDLFQTLVSCILARYQIYI